MSKKVVIPYIGVTVSPQTDVSISDIDSGRIVQPGTYAWYAELKLRMLSELSHTTAELKIHRAQLDFDLRDTHKAAGEKFTESSLTAEILLDKRVQDLQDKVDTCAAWVSYLNDILEALRQRRDMLQSIAVDQRKEKVQS